jgi:peroxiredoxin
MANENLTPCAGVIEIGEPAPDFTLVGQNRREWMLSDAVKKGDVVLGFFPFAFTDVCSSEMQYISDDMQAIKDKGAEVVGISCDSFAALKAWAKQMGFEQTLLSDLHRHVCRAYGLYWPQMNVAGRGTVVIEQADDGKGVVKWSESRPPSEPMNFGNVLAKVG